MNNIIEYGEQMLVIRSLGLIPKGFNNIWYNNTYEMTIDFIDNKVIISNIKEK